MQKILIPFVVILMFGLLRVAGGQTEMKMVISDQYGKTSKIDWYQGDWKDKKTNEVYRKLRTSVDKLPARNHKVNPEQIKQLMSRYRNDFKAKPSYETFFLWLYICGKYPTIGFEYEVEINRFLFQFRSPNCYEYARAAFIYVAEKYGTSANFPKGFAKKFRPFATGDWLLTEALIRHYSRSSGHSKDDYWWGWKEAKRLSETMPDGMYGFGRLRVDAANPVITTSMTFLDQEVAFIDTLLSGNYYDANGQARLRNVKQFYLTVKKRIEDYKKKHPGG